MHAVHAVELASHFTQFFGVYDFEEFVPLSPQSSFLHAASFGHCLGQRLQALILTSTGFEFTGEDYGRSRRAADDGSIGSFQGRYFELFVQRTRKDDVSAAVIAGDHAEHDGTFEIDYGSADLSAVLKLQAPHRLRRTVKS